MSFTIDKANKQINEINNQLGTLSDQQKAQTTEINDNSDYTNMAKSKKIEAVDRQYQKDYGDLMDQKKQVVTETMDSLSENLYSGRELKNPIAFDRAVHSFSQKKDGELITMLRQKPTQETKRAIYKAATTGYPSFDVLAKASELYPDDKTRIENYFQWQQQYGVLEDRTKKLSRRLGIAAE